MYFNIELSILQNKLRNDIEKLTQEHDTQQKLIDLEYSGKLELAKIEMRNKTESYYKALEKEIERINQSIQKFKLHKR